MSRLDAAAPGLALALCLIVLGAGTGMIFPTLTLSYQSAVPFSELGVATALNQFSRSIGSTLGAALFGSLLIARFVPEVQAALPPELSGLLAGPAGASLRDPQALLNPAAAEAVRSSLLGAFSEAQAPVVADLVIAAIRTGLAGALHWVFAAAAITSVVGLIGSLLWRELPVHRRRPA